MDIFCYFKFRHNRRNGFCKSEAGWQAEAVFWPQMRSQICQENPQVYLLHFIAIAMEILYWVFF